MCLLSMLAVGQSTFPVMLLKAKIPFEWRKFLHQNVRSIHRLASLLVMQGHRPFTRRHHRNKEGLWVYQRCGYASRGIPFLTPPADRLKSSKFDVPDIIDHVTHCFDETTKRLFKSLDEVSYIQFGSPAETQAGLGIQRGKMKLSGFVPLHP